MFNNKTLSGLSEDVFFLESISEKNINFSKALNIPLADVQRDMQNLIRRFKTTKKGKNPIDMTVGEFKAASEYFKSEKNALSFSPPKDAPVVAQNNRAIVWAVNSHAFSQSLNKFGVTWCISTANPQYLKKYLENNNFYVLQSKDDPNEIYSIATNKQNNSFRTEGNVSVDAQNDEVDPEDILAKFGIDRRAILNWKYETPEVSEEEYTTLKGPATAVYGADGIIASLRAGAPLNQAMYDIIFSFKTHTNASEARASAEKLARFFIKEKKTAYLPLIELLFVQDSFLLSQESVESLINLFLGKNPNIQNTLHFLAYFGSIPGKYRDKKFETASDGMEEDLQSIYPARELGEYSANIIPYLNEARSEEVLNWMKSGFIQYTIYAKVLSKYSPAFKKVYTASIQDNRVKTGETNIDEFIRNFILSYPGGVREKYATEEEAEGMVKPLAAYLKETEKSALFQRDMLPLLSGILERPGLNSEAQKHIVHRIELITTPEQRAALTAYMIGEQSKGSGPLSFIRANPFNLPQYKEVIVNEIEGVLRKVEDDYEKTNWYYTIMVHGIIAAWDDFLPYLTPELLYRILHHKASLELTDPPFDHEILAKTGERIWKYMKRHLPNSVTKAGCPYDSVLYWLGQRGRMPNPK